MSSFEDDYDPNVKKVTPTRGLKINNTNSSIKQPVDNSAVFEGKVKSYLDKDATYTQKLMDLAIQLKAILQDKTLPVNKTQIIKNAETEIINNLVAVGAQINVDENRPESEGSNSLCHILMRMLLVQRDNNNELAYKVSELEKTLFKLKTELKINNEPK